MLITQFWERLRKNNLLNIFIFSLKFLNQYKSSNESNCIGLLKQRISIVFKTQNLTNLWTKMKCLPFVASPLLYWVLALFSPLPLLLPFSSFFVSLPSFRFFFLPFRLQSSHSLRVSLVFEFSDQSHFWISSGSSF